MSQNDSCLTDTSDMKQAALRVVLVLNYQVDNLGDVPVRMAFPID